MRFLRPRPILLLILLVLIGAALAYRSSHFARAQTAQESQTPCCSEPDTTAPREIDFPYYSLRDGFNSTLLLVSASPEPMDLFIAVHSSSGQTVLAPAMTIQPQEKLPLDIRKLLTDLSADVAGDFAEGNISVHFNGTIMPVVGQLSLSNPARSLAWESLMVDNSPGVGLLPKMLNSLWWGLGGGREAKFVVSNTSGDPAVADVFLDFLGERHASAPLSFAPHQTKVLSVAQLLAGLNASTATAPEGGITIVQRGPSATLIAQGKITDSATGFSMTVNFLDPGVPIGKPAKDSPYAGTGTFTPHVIVRNLLGSPQSVTVTIEYPAETGTEQTALAPFALGGYATQDISLDSATVQLPLPLPFCSVRVQYSGAPGSAVGEVVSIEQRGSLVIDGKLANEGDGWAGSGANPWHLDDQTESILFLTNMGDKAARIGFEVQANAVHYYLTDLKLKAHETRAIDLRKLRDAQKEDFKKHKIPAAASDGSVSWIRLDNVPVMGRVVVLERRGGVARNYDCGTCQCPAGYSMCSISPTSVTGIPGDTQQFTATATFTLCNGVTNYYDVTTASTWGSTYPTVATVNTTGFATAMGGGSTSITATHTDSTYRWSVAEQLCNEFSTMRSGLGTCDVQALDHFNSSVTSTPVPGESNSVVSGQQAQVQVQAITTTGAVMTLYRGTVHFSSGDTTATLPGDYTYTSTDNGSHTFNVTLKIVSGTSATRDLTVRDNVTGITSTQNIYVWFNVFMDVERWKNCNFVSCPNLGSYYCQTAYIGNGYSQQTAFVALPASDTTNLYNRTVTVRWGSSRATTFIGDAGPVPGYNNYWNTAIAVSPGGCLSDLLATNLGVSNGCNGTAPYGNATVYWRFGN